MREAVQFPGRWWAGVLAAVVAGLLTLVTGIPAHADSPIVVSSFVDDRQERPGAVIARVIRVANLGNEPMTVRVVPRMVEPLEDGATRFATTEDPFWAGRVDISEPQFTLAPKAMKEVRLTIRIPETAPPDDYLLGVVVGPVESSVTGVQIVGEIGAVLPVVVAGPRNRSVEIVESRAPQLVFLGPVVTTVRVRNTGTTFAQVTSELDVINSFTQNLVGNIQNRDRVRIAPGLSREFSFSWDPGITLGRFRLEGRVGYPPNDESYTNLEFANEVWVIHPLFPALAAGALLLIIAAVVTRRRPGPRRTPAARLPPLPPPLPLPAPPLAVAAAPLPKPVVGGSTPDAVTPASAAPATVASPSDERPRLRRVEPAPDPRAVEISVRMSNQALVAGAVAAVAAVLVVLVLPGLRGGRPDRGDDA